MSAVNLRQRFGRQFRVVYEPSYYAQYGPRARVDDPHYQIIPGARGHVYAWDSQRLAASTHTSGSTASKLKALPFAEIWTDGEDGVTVLICPEHLGQTAQLLKLRRRRQVSAKERRRLRELGRRHGFQPAAKLPSKDCFQDDLEARPGVREGQPDRKHESGKRPRLCPRNDSGRSLAVAVGKEAGPGQ